MTFEDLERHFDDCACTMEELEKDVYLVKNCINGNDCMVERLKFYTTGTLAHYLYELNIEIPAEVEDAVFVYTNFRKHISGVGFVPVPGEEDEAAE